MTNATPAVPAAFEDLVRDSPLHLYDPGRLHAHRLLTYAPAGSFRATAPGKALRQALLDALDAMRPAPGTAVARAWRAYRILELRYVEGHDVADVVEQVALSKSQCHREHQRALQADASLLWERWGLDSVADRPVGDAGDRQARDEARELAQAPDAATFDSRAVVEGVMGLVPALCRQRQVALRLTFPDTLPCLRGFRVALHYALLTLLIPALQPSEPGGFTFAASATAEDLVLALDGPATERQDEPFLLEESRTFVAALGGALAWLPAAPGSGVAAPRHLPDGPPAAAARGG